MSKKDKILKRLKSSPKDFTYNELKNGINIFWVCRRSKR